MTAMLRGLWRLTWLEIKIFMREPLGVIGTLGLPVLIFVAMGTLPRPGPRYGSTPVPAFVSVDLPVFTGMLISLSAVLSFVTIIAIYREGGILKRLRATPLRPHTILTAHVVVKLLLTGATLLVTVLVGARHYPISLDARFFSFAIALLLSTLGFLSIGFLIASLVPTARFAQPVGSLILYPMLGLSGLFTSIDELPPMLHAAARALPVTYAVSLLKGIWHGEGWWAHATDVAVLALMFMACTAIAARVFRWE
jgi:ABC-2 type transport system permease protein